jgi:glutamate synthase (NADPH/NADH) large chain
MAMVEIEKVEGEAVKAGENGDLSGLLADPLHNDVARLHALIERHRHYTGSARAKYILDNWNRVVSKFVKIVPIDYRRALIDMAAAKAKEAAKAGSREAHG